MPCGSTWQGQRSAARVAYVHVLRLGPLLAHSLFVLMGGMGWSLWQTAAAQTCELPALLRHIEAEVQAPLHCTAAA